MTVLVCPLLIHIGGEALAKDKREQRKSSHTSLKQRVEYATKGWSREKRSAFHDYLHKNYSLEKNHWDQNEFLRQAEIFSAWHWFGS